MNISSLVKMIKSVKYCIVSLSMMTFFLASMACQRTDLDTINPTLSIEIGPVEIKEDSTSADTVMKIVLCIGQSNMAGRAEIEDEDAITLEEVYLFNEAEEWEFAANPLNKYSTIRKDLDMQKLGPAWTFGIRYQEMTDSRLGLVVNARGGTSIKEWAKGTDYYNETVARALAAKQKGDIIGIIWHQGEGDRNRASQYTELFRDMIESMRTDLGLPELPVVVGQISRAKEASIEINEVLLNMENEIPFVASVSSEGLTDNGDSTHFDTKAQRTLGERFAQAFFELLGETE